MLKNKKVNKKVMNRYGMFLKNGIDLIHLTHQETQEEAIKYFAAIKQMPVKEFSKLFIVTKIKN